MAKCKFSDNGDDCTFKSKLGAVKLSVEGTTGTVLFQKATYSGTDIPNLPAATISFTVVAGRADLAVVYSFSDPANGAGVLKEECDVHPKLLDVSAKEPSAVYHICGQASVTRSSKGRP